MGSHKRVLATRPPVQATRPEVLQHLTTPKAPQPLRTQAPNQNPLASKPPSHDRWAPFERQINEGSSTRSVTAFRRAPSSSLRLQCLRQCAKRLPIHHRRDWVRGVHALPALAETPICATCSGRNKTFTTARPDTSSWVHRHHCRRQLCRRDLHPGRNPHRCCCFRGASVRCCHHRFHTSLGGRNARHPAQPHLAMLHGGQRHHHRHIPNKLLIAQRCLHKRELRLADGRNLRTVRVDLRHHCFGHRAVPEEVLPWRGQDGGWACLSVTMAILPAATWLAPCHYWHVGVAW